MPTLHAQPYNRDAAGFYFTSQGEFKEKSEALRDRYGNVVEEFEISVIEGTDEECDILNACHLDQCNFGAALEALEELKDYELPALFFLLDNFSMSLEDARAKLDEVAFNEGTILEAATELFDECYLNDLPENLRYYVDYEKFARDCEISGDMTEFSFAGTTYTCTNTSGL